MTETVTATAVKRLAAALAAAFEVEDWRVGPTARRRLVKAILAADPALEPALELGLAWAEAEAARPDGWTLDLCCYPDEFADTLGKARADVWNTNGGVSKGHQSVYADTPAAALRALAEKLR